MGAALTKRKPQINNSEALLEGEESPVAESSEAAKDGLLQNTWNAITSTASTVLNAITSIPRTIWSAVKAATSFVWREGIQMTSSYPNGKADAENLTAAKIFKQLAGFVVSMVATTAVRLARLVVYAAAASVFFFTVLGIVSTAPISLPVAAGIAALTTLTSAAVVSAVLAIATKSMWEEPSKAIDKTFYKLVNLLAGNTDKDGKLNKYGSGEELDYLGKVTHKLGYNAAESLLNAVSFVLSLPSKAIGMVFGTAVQEQNQVAPEPTATEHAKCNLSLPTADTPQPEESPTLTFTRDRANSQMTLRQAAEAGLMGPAVELMSEIKNDNSRLRSQLG